MMRLEVFGRKQQLANLTSYLDLYVDGLKKTTKDSISMVSVSDDIWTLYLPDAL
jgi:hypothetical protein